jgi:hypothetical protein
MTMPDQFFGSRNYAFLRDRQQRACSHPPATVRKTINVSVIPPSASFRGGIHNPPGGAECHVPLRLQGLWIWIPGSARYARGPGMTEGRSFGALPERFRDAPGTRTTWTPTGMNLTAG